MTELLTRFIRSLQHKKGQGWGPGLHTSVKGPAVAARLEAPTGGRALDCHTPDLGMRTQDPW